MAAPEGDKCLAEGLIENGAEVNGRREGGVTALHLAAPLGQDTRNWLPSFPSTAGSNDEAQAEIGGCLG